MNIKYIASAGYDFYISSVCEEDIVAVCPPEFISTAVGESHLVIDRTEVGVRSIESKPSMRTT